MTAKDLTKEFGVSQTTMSLILNGKPGVSDQLRSDILKEINSRGYSYLIKNKEPAAAASAQNKNICFVVYYDSGKLLGGTNNSFFPYIIDGIEKCTRSHGYALTYIKISRDHIEEGIQRILQSNCAGFVIFATELKGDQIEPFRTLDIPFVLLDTFYDNLEINSVTVNNRQGIYLAVEHLIKNAHKEIGYLSGGLELTSFIERRYYMLKILRSFGFKGMERYFYTVGYPDTEAYKGTLSLIKDGKDLPTAFVAANDLVAAGAIKAFKECGYRIPEDISIIGFDDRPVCTMTEPNLTTIQIPRHSFGAEAVELLFHQISGATKCTVKIELNNKLIVRDSVASIK